jgi:hypothetical protein
MSHASTLTGNIHKGVPCTLRFTLLDSAEAPIEDATNVRVTLISLAGMAIVRGGPVGVELDPAYEIPVTDDDSYWPQAAALVDGAWKVVITSRVEVRMGQQVGWRVQGESGGEEFDLVLEDLVLHP